MDKRVVFVLFGAMSSVFSRHEKMGLKGIRET